MAVVVADLVYPAGQIQDRLFPDGDIETAVGQWITDGTTAAVAAGTPAGSQDEAITYFVYWQAYAAVGQRIASTPSTEKSFNDRVTTWSAWQLQNFAKMADYYRSEFERVATPDAETAAPAFSGAVSNEVTW